MRFGVHGHEFKADGTPCRVSCCLDRSVSSSRLNSDGILLDGSGENANARGMRILVATRRRAVCAPVLSSSHCSRSCCTSSRTPGAPPTGSITNGCRARPGLVRLPRKQLAELEFATVWQEFRHHVLVPVTHLLTQFSLEEREHNTWICYCSDLFVEACGLYLGACPLGPRWVALRGRPAGQIVVTVRACLKSVSIVVYLRLSWYAVADTSAATAAAGPQPPGESARAARRRATQR